MDDTTGSTANRSAKAGDPCKPPPRPRYDVVGPELERLRKALIEVRACGADATAALSDPELLQVDMAITHIEVAAKLLTCIQDQAPYGMVPMKR
jgi:hypothetical protein